MCEIEASRKWKGKEISYCVVSKIGLLSKGGHIMVVYIKIRIMDELLIYTF